MTKAIRAGLAYFALVFAVAFLLGTVRTLWIAPALGATNAVLVELPVMLAVSWFIARWLVPREAINSAAEQLTMGVTAFATLMFAERGLAVLLLDQSADLWFRELFGIPGILGLLGQIGFGAMPLLVGRRI
ncbi:hypothetical protein [Sphingorhabdus pulchriflava]|nr:hypothetical protein [Sphingorhabdus pulchriflava]